MRILILCLVLRFLASLSGLPICRPYMRRSVYFRTVVRTDLCGAQSASRTFALGSLYVFLLCRTAVCSVPLRIRNMFLYAHITQHTQHLPLAEWNGATESSRKRKNQPAHPIPPAPAHQFVQGHIRVAASPHTRDPVRFRQNQPQDERKNSQNIRGSQGAPAS